MDFVGIYLAGKLPDDTFFFENDSGIRLQGKPMEQDSLVRRIGKKVIVLFLVSFVLFIISVVTTTMITTATFTTTEAGVIIEKIRTENGANALWAFIIPAAFFLVLSSRNWKAGKRKSDR
jgi:hypothetical protein